MLSSLIGSSDHTVHPVVGETTALDDQFSRLNLESDNTSPAYHRFTETKFLSYMLRKQKDFVSEGIRKPVFLLLFVMLPESVKAAAGWSEKPHFVHGDQIMHYIRAVDRKPDVSFFSFSTRHMCLLASTLCSGDTRFILRAYLASPESKVHRVVEWMKSKDSLYDPKQLALYSKDPSSFLNPILTQLNAGNGGKIVGGRSWVGCDDKMMYAREGVSAAYLPLWCVDEYTPCSTEKLP